MTFIRFAFRFALGCLTGRIFFRITASFNGTAIANGSVGSYDHTGHAEARGCGIV